MIRKRDASLWPAWLQMALRSPVASFARRLQRDEKAVAEALRLPWSNGMVEGQIDRMKLIERQMYGRAGFDLLRLRVLQRAWFLKAQKDCRRTSRFTSPKVSHNLSVAH
jgi:transposase